MITISPVQPADVAVLKCIYFQLVKTLKESMWYGIECHTKEYTSDIETAFTYLEVLNTACEIPHSFQCEIKTFISKKSSFCVFSLPDKCITNYMSVEEAFLTTEDNDPIITENSNNILA